MSSIFSGFLTGLIIIILFFTFLNNDKLKSLENKMDKLEKHFNTTHEELYG